MELDVAFDDSFNWRRLFRTIVYGSPVTLYLSVVADWLNKRFPINFGLIETVYKSGTKSGNGFWGNIRGFALGALYLFLLGVAIAIVFMALTGFIKRIIDAISGFVLFVSAIAGSVVILLLLYAVFSVFKVENDNVIAVTMISAMVFVVMVANSLLMEFQAKKESESPSLNKEAIRGIYINPGLNAHCIIWLDSTSDSDNCRFIYRNGCLYQGEWHNEQPNGKGKMIFAKDKLDFFDEDVDWQKWVPNR
ncbi:MAG: hypothetical protein IK086_07100, partial [Clostridia bacterium]|nr:hypothetical protein [Clostridia bacterium]